MVPVIVSCPVACGIMALKILLGHTAPDTQHMHDSPTTGGVERSKAAVILLSHPLALRSV